jgi:hypothetical protein
VIVASRGRGGWAPAHWRQADEGRPLPQSSWFHASVQTCWATPATKRASRVRKPNRHLQQDQYVGVFHFAAQVNKAIVAKAQVGPIHQPPAPASTPVAKRREGRGGGPSSLTTRLVVRKRGVPTWRAATWQNCT